MSSHAQPPVRRGQHSVDIVAAILPCLTLRYYVSNLGRTGKDNITLEGPDQRIGNRNDTLRKG